MPRNVYPPGVTGREYEIQGPDREWEAPPVGRCGCGWPYRAKWAEPDEGSDYDPIEPEDPEWKDLRVSWEEYAGAQWWTCPKCDDPVDYTPEPGDY
jgi:hypothetical protein